MADRDRLKYEAAVAIRQTGEACVATIESVNVGRERLFENDIGRTGIYKVPVSGPVAVGAQGVEGDHIADAKHHGGPDQAVYLYFSDDYAWWSKTLGRELGPGTFGENLTIAGLVSADMAIGDRLVAGEVVLEVTAPRIPCNTLARRMGDPGFVKAFRHAELPGAYCRVIETGFVSAGMPVAHQPYQGKRVGAVGMFRDTFMAKTLDPARIREVLEAPIAVRERANWSAFLPEAAPTR